MSEESGAVQLPRGPGVKDFRIGLERYLSVSCEYTII